MKILIGIQRIKEIDHLMMIQRIEEMITETEKTRGEQWTIGNRHIATTIRILVDAVMRKEVVTNADMKIRMMLQIVRMVHLATVINARLSIRNR